MRWMNLKLPIGLGALAAWCGSALAVVPNDHCASATKVADGVHMVSLSGATADVKATGDSAERDVWFQYTASFDGFLALEVPGADGNGKLSVWSNCPESGIMLTASYPADGPIDSASLEIMAGETYLIRVADRGTTDDGLELILQAMPRGGSDGSGPDVQLLGIGSISSYGPLSVAGESIAAYAIGSRTCNLGDANLLWTSRGTPALAMNLYRLHNGRLMQIGLSWVKTACCAAAGSGCGLACNGQGGSVLGAGCLDVYGSGWNGGQQWLGPRSSINAYTGAGITVTGATSGDAIYKRLQVKQRDITTTEFPGATYFFEGVYAASDDAGAGNWYNNSTYQYATRGTGIGFSFPTGGQPIQNQPALDAWRRYGGGPGTAAPFGGVADPRVNIATINIPAEGRYHYASKVTDLGGGRFLYDYAVFNLNSDRSGGSFSVPIPAGVSVTGVGFNSPFYHSGEPFDNTPWTATVSGNSVTWTSPQTFAQNPNSNALRWGTMYNFWFEANSASGNGSATLGLFKPGTPSSIALSVPVPVVPIGEAGDMNCDGSVNFDDIPGFSLAVIGPAQYLTEYPSCVYLNGDINGDGVVNFDDINGFVACVIAGGCR